MSTCNSVKDWFDLVSFNSVERCAQLTAIASCKYLLKS